MSKKRADGVRVAKAKKVAEEGAFKEVSWGELKKRARRSAEFAGFDVEGIVFGIPLQKKISEVVKSHIEATEELGQRSGVFNTKACTLLQRARDALANDLGWRFSDDGLDTVDLQDVSLSLLYLFPRLWKTIDKPFSLDELKALDIDKLLSERRSTQVRR